MMDDRQLLDRLEYRVRDNTAIATDREQSGSNP